MTELYPFTFFKESHGVSKGKSLDANPGQCLTIIFIFIFPLLKTGRLLIKEVNDLYVSSSDSEQQFSWHAH